MENSITIGDQQWFINTIPADFDQHIWDKLNQKTKPPGSLGVLEQLSFQIARIQQTLTPALIKPMVLVFAGDHGVASSGLVNPYPQEVTHQMVLNFIGKGAAINAMAQVAEMDVAVVDAGVNHEFDPDLPLINAKMGFGTADYCNQPAMDLKLCHLAIKKGAQVVGEFADKGTNVVGFGEMGIGNSSSASLIMSTLCGIPLSACVGMGTGAVGDFFTQKLSTLENAQVFHGLNQKDDPVKILSTFGGFEIAQMVGGMIEAASRKCVIMVDGFISTAAFLIAHAITPSLLDFAVFTHKSGEQGHTKALYYLGVSPLLQLGMRLGEGTGCAAAHPLVKMAVAIMNEMASFDAAGVSGETEK